MTELYGWLAAAVLFIAAYLAALKLSLVRHGRSSLVQRLEAQGTADEAAWISANFAEAAFAASLLRTVARLTFFTLVLAEVVDLRARASLTWPDLLISGLIAVPLLCRSGRCRRTSFS